MSVDTVYFVNKPSLGHEAFVVGRPSGRYISDGARVQAGEWFLGPWWSTRQESCQKISLAVLS